MRDRQSGPRYVCRRPRSPRALGSYRDTEVPEELRRAHASSSPSRDELSVTLHRSRVQLDRKAQPRMAPTGLQGETGGQRKELVQSAEYDAAFLMAPTPIERVQAVASAGESMPPKSTYFFPKVPTGLVFNPLSE